ncbi:CD151 antigen-like [Mytilus trossulus]|uniref:CD151 antigen-like n=1 Tax=Mytilus trossulus TaxID=6551 RepID=UPI0030064871
MDYISKCGRILLVVLNVIFLIIGLVIFALGMVLKFGFEKIKPYLDDALNTVKGGISEIMKSSGNLGVHAPSDSDLKEIDELVEIAESILKDVAIALIIVGSVMLIIVLLGCCGACYKIKIFLFLYSVIIFILLVAMVTVAGLYLNKREIIDNKVKPILKTTIKDSYKGLKGVNFISLAWNFAMQQFSCCGVDSSDDFKVCTSWDKKPVSTVSQDLTSPLACCKTIPTATSLNVNALSCAISPKIADSNSKTGCYDVLWSYVEKYNKIVMTVVILMSLIEAVIIFLGCWIACKEGDGKVSPSD